MYKLPQRAGGGQCPPGCPRWQYARWLSANRYFPDPPGIGGQCPQPISPAGVPPVAMRTVAFSKSLLPLQRPVSFYVRYRAFSDFPSTAWEQGTPKSHKPKTGAGVKKHHPSPSEGSIYRRLGGILKGKTPNGSEFFPLSRLLCLLSCRSKKVRPRWQALAESRLENKPKGYNRVTITTSKYHPPSKPELHRPLAPSVTCGDSSLPEGAMGCVPFHIGLFFGEVPAVESLSHGYAVPAPSRRELRRVAADNAHGRFLQIVTSLTRPVSVACPPLFPYSLYT